MPHRHFDRHLLRARRRAADVSGAQLAERMQVATNQISKWETGASFPTYEKFPAIARALGADLDELFPRTGAPDLADLRCDAELTQPQAGERIGTSTTPINRAERARQRLKAEYVPALAAAYGVTESELMAAQDRTFGAQDSAPAEPVATQTFAERIAQALAASFPDGAIPGDVELTRRLNQEAGRDLLAPGVLEALRSGARNVEEAFPAPADATAFHEALARVLGVSPLVLMSNQTVARNVVDGIRQLADGGRSRLALAARGAEEFGLSKEMLDKLTDLIAQAEREGGPEARRG
ncbi:helix-turn-helix domain-containing protein [Streptacidiphilus sp. EB103A]|uniref:helix-turn-helix domain-containing protein n=1 Tax=Streptacidiphilus sp. EB103A TaxID=3156275 RepID=UPI0035135350